MDNTDSDMASKDIIKLDEFDQIINNNKTLGRDWYYGLKGRWWWGMSEKHARKIVAKLEEDTIDSISELEEKAKRHAIKLEEKAKKHITKLEEKAKKEAKKKEEYMRKREEEIRKKEEYMRKREEDESERISANKIVLASTWDIRCGIATYTKYLLDSLRRIVPDSFVVDPIINNELQYNSRGKLMHLQHEFGIIPNPPEKIRGKLIITWHAALGHINDEIKKYESKYDVVAHIVHSKHMRNGINSSKDVWIVPHGSTLMHQMRKEDARRILGINVGMPIGFVFGFQSGDKNYQRMIDAAKNTNIHLIISGAQHWLGRPLNIHNSENVTFINRFMEENEVNLYALASDILLFDYIGKNHYSVSGALHRIVGAGRPIVCSDIKHFSDIEDGSDCLKFKDREELERCIRHALENEEKFSLAAKKYSEDTSWEKIAKMHIDIYRKYVSF